MKITPMFGIVILLQPLPYRRDAFHMTMINQTQQACAGCKCMVEKAGTNQSFGDDAACFATHTVAYAASGP
jgi:hypothetical protein